MSLGTVGKGAKGINVCVYGDSRIFLGIQTQCVDILRFYFIFFSPFSCSLTCS